MGALELNEGFNLHYVTQTKIFFKKKLFFLLVSH